MDNSFRQQGSETQQQLGGLSASLQVFRNILNWLAGLFQLTEQEQEEAGIQPSNSRYR
jgi:hypothetical protein